MSKVRARYWKVNENTVKLQVKTHKEQHKLQEILPGWQCISFGYAPKTREDIYIFERAFASESDWITFLDSEQIKQFLDMKEVLND
tara:strand:- start:58 stop:315 length:258 start_codon:yes stop_codon:yes gene_type:complete